MSKKKLEFKKPGDVGYGKNIQAVKDMLEGKYQSKIQVGVGDQELTPNRKVGDTWTDSDGIEWEQKKGYYSRVSSIMRGIADSCNDCDKLLLRKRDKDTYKRMSRCYECQINFETKLMNYPIKHWAWVRLQVLRRWGDIDNDMEKIIFDEHDRKKRLFDKSVANAMANANIDMQVNKNTK